MALARLALSGGEGAGAYAARIDSEGPYCALTFGMDVESPKPSKRSQKANYAGEFEWIWAAYPKRPNNARKPAFERYCQRRKKVAYATLLRCTENYAKHIEREAAKARARGLGYDRNLIMQGQTFFGPNERYEPFALDDGWYVAPVRGGDSARLPRE